VVSTWARLKPLIIFVLLAHTLIVFVTNNVLFPVSYLPDQEKYLTIASYIRGDPTVRSEFFSLPNYGITVRTAATIFAYFPVPFVGAVQAIGLVNVLLYFLGYLYLQRRGIHSRLARWFYLLYPSLALYSALALRDTLILLFMIFSVDSFLRKKYLFSLLMTVPLFLLKFQNALLLWVVYFAFLLLTERKFWMILLALIMSIGIFVAFRRYFSISLLETYRKAFYIENGGSASSYVPIGGLGGWARVLITAIPNFLFAPMPWQARNGLQLIQGLENAVVLYLFVRLIYLKRRFHLKSHTFLFLLLFICISSVVYGIVILNFGTAARYRFPFVTIFLVYLSVYTVGRPSTAYPPTIIRERRKERRRASHQVQVD